MYGNLFHSHRLKRQLTLWPLVLIGVSNTLEASIFVLLGEGVNISGGLLPFSFLLGALLAICASWVYAKVASVNPHSGADIEFIFEILPKKSIAFGISWLIILGDISFIALNAFGIGLYLKDLLGIPLLVISAAVLLLVTILNITGIRKTSEVANVLTLFLIFCLLVLVGFSISSVDLPLWVNNLPSDLTKFPWIIMAGTAFIYSTYIGYEDITSIAGEVKEPQNTVPKALLYTVLITMVLYTCMAFILVSNLPNATINSSEIPLLSLAENVHFPVQIIYLSIIIAVTTTLITMLLVVSRKMLSLLGQIAPNSSLTRLNRYQVPYKLIIISCILSFAILLTNSLSFFAYVTNSVYLIGLLATTVSLVIYEKQKFHLQRSAYKIPYYPWSIYLVIVLSGALLCTVDLIALVGILSWLILGHFIYKFKNILL